LVEASPVQLLYRPGAKEPPKDRILSYTEIKTLLANLDDVPRAPRAGSHQWAIDQALQESRLGVLLIMREVCETSLRLARHPGHQVCAVAHRGAMMTQSAADRLSGNQLEMTHECSTKFCNSRSAAFREPRISILDIVPQTIIRHLAHLSVRADHWSAHGRFQVLLQ
jgi:hypothetical protein